MIDVNKVPTADIIAQRIFGVVNVGVIEQELVANILDDWNNEWIGIIAEQHTERSDNTEKARSHDNDKRLRDRINKIRPRGQGNSIIAQIDDPGF